MAEDRLKIWETLFKRALVVIDSVARTGASFEPWSFGGGTVLMRRHRHRVSKDVVLARVAAEDEYLRREFAHLEVLEFRASYDECLRIVKGVFQVK